MALLAGLSSIILTSRNIKLTNRPYISIYVEFIDTVTASKYLVIKNFGKTAGIVTKITYSQAFKNHFGNDQFSSIINCAVMPQQKFMTFIDNETKLLLSATIEYKDLNGKTYTESYPIKFSATDQLTWVESNTPYGSENDSSETKAIHAAAHLITKHLD